jgi:PDZ domain-containing protein
MFDSGNAQSAKKSGRSRRIIARSAFSLIILGGLAASFVQLPFVIERPGPAYNVLAVNGNTPVIEISGKKTYVTDSTLNIMTVNVMGQPGSGPSAFQLLTAYFDKASSITPMDQVYAPDTSSAEVNTANQIMMASSQQDAIAAALHQLKIPFTSKISVALVSKNTPADGVFKVGDEILALDGHDINSFAQLTSLIQKWDANTPLAIKFSRDGKVLDTAISPVMKSGHYRIGVYVDVKNNFPFKVKLNLAGVGGPSGGMIFALGIYDKLTPGSLAGSDNISGTGTIDAQGNVGPIGGIRQKMYTALRAGSTWFLAPDSNCDELVGHIPDGLHVTKVSTLTDAIKALEVISSGGDTASLPACTK